MRSTILATVFAVAAGVGGYLLFWTPWLGCTLAYAAPMLACAGLVLALRARRAERSRAASGLVATNAVTLPVLAAIALSCGSLNAIGSVALLGLSGAGTVAATAPGVAASVAGAAIDDHFPPHEFWGGETFGGYMGTWPNPVGLGPLEEEDDFRAAIRRTVVTTGFLLWLYGEIYGEPGARSTGEAAPTTDASTPDGGV